MKHRFTGEWISNSEMAALEPKNIFRRQLGEPLAADTEHLNRHILFRKKFNCRGGKACIFITADDYYKLYINGKFVAQGPSPSYHFQYNYNSIDITPYVIDGENTIAVHTLYQGLINRVWQSGDLRHGLLCDVVVDGITVAASDADFKVHTHSGYTALGKCGYDTQFLERYDSCAAEVGFEQPDFDDSAWENAVPCRFDDHTIAEQKSHMLVFEDIAPVSVTRTDNVTRYDFGANYVGYLRLKAKGRAGEKLILRFGQELEPDGGLRYSLRANCVYEEEWILSGGEDVLEQFDYKSFRYAEIIGQAELIDAKLKARHYPFVLNARLKDESLRDIWELCVHTQKYGVQEVIQDCMEREKGFYVGDGCYSALTNMILTGDDSMVRKLIDDAFASQVITPTLVTCLDCSFMQEIAEFPLIMIYLILWHYRFIGDKQYLLNNYSKCTALLDAYRNEYEKDGLLRDLDKWCVVEWPKNFQQDYAVDILEGKVCHEAHVSINAYYLYAIRVVNEMARILGLEPYRDESAVQIAFEKAFYDKDKKLFHDGESNDHITLVGNSFVYGFGLYPNEECRQNILSMLDEMGMHSLSFFCTFPMLMGLARDGEKERLHTALASPETWRRMLREDATTTFEGWGKDTKWNTSLFHMTMTYAAIFLADTDNAKLFK